MPYALSIALGAIALATFVVSPRVRDADGFFRGWSQHDRPPGVLTLTFSQVTTWIFARSLLTAAILAFHFGIAGGLAYAAYYLSFYTGWLAIRGIRFRHGHDSVHAFLRDRFGRSGTWTYDFVVAVRLLSEVFANLLTIGIIFGPAGSDAYALSISLLALFTLGYSMLGGLRASLRTDVLQMSVFLALLGLILARLMGAEGWSLGAVAFSSPAAFEGGWILLAVAFLQVWSYPLHDPVMMDRGFVSDERTTRRSFLHAGWISAGCILAFSMLGIFAGLHRDAEEDLTTALTRLLGSETMLVINLALIVSALSTLDSTLSSAAKLTIRDMGWASPTLVNGRLAMALFLFGGLLFLYFGTDDLYSAVAVSGTASLFLAPVLFFSILGNRRVSRVAYLVAFAAAMFGAALYYLEAGGHLAIMGPWLGVEAKYAKLLWICAIVLLAGNGAFALGMQRRARTKTATSLA